MMPLMDRAAIERAEKVARGLEARSALAEAVKEAKSWRRPDSLRTRPVRVTKMKDYVFTEAQLEIARRSLDARGAV